MKKMKNNYINIKESEKDKFIYRITSFERMAEMFLTEKMTLVKPKKWEDPFENFILNYFEEEDSREDFDFNFRNSLYANCWTFHNRSDALWRIYSPDKYSVCVRTTIRKLFEALFEQGGHLKNNTCFIGKVEYSNQSEMYKKLQLFKTQFDSKPKGSGLAETILFKRTAFQHECEVRLIYQELFPYEKEIFQFDFYPDLIFDQITFDPRMGKNTYKALSTYLRENFNFNGKVMQSSLYGKPEKIFKKKINKINNSS